MRICFLANAASIHTLKWVNHFSRIGNDVHVLSFEALGPCDPRVTHHRLPMFYASGLRYFLAACRVRKLLSTIRPDLVHAHYASGYGTLGRLSGFHPFVLSVWGSDVFEFPARSAWHRRLIKKNLASADHICSTSRFMADHVRKYWEGPVTLTPFGVDCKEFNARNGSSAGSGEFVIGTVKTLDKKYGIEYLIRSFALLVAKYKQSKKLRLVIAGEGPLRKKLEALARDSGVSELTTFLGHVPHDRVPSLLNTFSVFVAVSVFDSETFGVAVVEASACELPVVVSDVGGLPEVVRNGITGLIVPRRDAEATAKAISTLIENESLRRKLGAAGRKFVLDNYEWSENASRMERLYTQLVPGAVYQAAVAAARVPLGGGITHGLEAVMTDIEDRKVLEAQFHDKLRDPRLRDNPELYAELTSNRKWYSITRQSREFTEQYLRQKSPGARALDFACGDGYYTLLMSEAGADAVGIDISGVSVQNAEREAGRRGLNAKFQVMDCENLTFPDSTFDLISVSGVLHHMDLDRAFSQLARVLKPNGSVFCAEPLIHNPVFQAYRKWTPHLRTEFEAEHILRRRDVLAARKYFDRLELQFFHLLDLGAVPFRNTRIFNPLLSALETMDTVLFKTTPLRWWAWQVLFVLSGPKHLQPEATAPGAGVQVPSTAHSA